MTEENSQSRDDRDLVESSGETNQTDRNSAGPASGSGERTAASVAPPGPRSPAEVRANDILSFIIGVRKLSAQTLNVDRNMRQIKNMSNVIFRHYIGYTAKGEYRIKHRKERCFSDEVKRLGLEDPFDYVQSVSSSEKVGKVTDAKIPKASGGAGVPEAASKDKTCKSVRDLTGGPKKVDYLKGVPLVDLTDFVPDSVVLDSSLVVEEFPAGTLSENCDSTNLDSMDLDSAFGDSDESLPGAVTFQPDGTVTFGDDDTLISERSGELTVLTDDESKLPIDDESKVPLGDESDLHSNEAQETPPARVSQHNEIHGVDKSD